MKSGDKKKKIDKMYTFWIAQKYTIKYFLLSLPNHSTLSEKINILRLIGKCEYFKICSLNETLFTLDLNRNIMKHVKRTITYINASFWTDTREKNIIIDCWWRDASFFKDWKHYMPIMESHFLFQRLETLHAINGITLAFSKTGNITCH